jgi:hypothetical protein
MPNLRRKRLVAVAVLVAATAGTYLLVQGPLPERPGVVREARFLDVGDPLLRDVGADCAPR